MKTFPPVTVNSTEPARVLTIGAVDDEASLRQILASSREGPRWLLQRMPSLASAMAMLRTQEAAVVISAPEVGEETWHDVLWALTTLPRPPLLIVSSRFADDALWAEALNLGAYDVLSAPFCAEEVRRVCTLAWLRWREDTAARHGNS